MRLVYFILVFIVCSPATASPDFLNGIMPYKVSASNIKGELIVRGSTRLEPMVRAWFKEFSALYPHIQTNIKASGSSAAPKALIIGKANIGAMSRPIKKKEIEAFVAEKGYPPMELKVAMDALAIYVNRKNPIKHLTLEEVDAIFSKDRKCSHDNGRNQDDIINWQQLGWNKGGEIKAHNFHQKSGGYGLFRKRVLCKGDYKKGLIGKHKTSPEMTAAIGKSIASIGYASRSGNSGYGAKIIALSRSKAFPYYFPNSRNIATNNYPLSRFLYLYLDKPPSEPMSPYLKEFIKYIYSTNGQNIISKAGAIPLPAQFIGQQLAEVNKGRNL